LSSRAATQAYYLVHTLYGLKYYVSTST
jgi:hypothetical protein